VVSPFVALLEQTDDHEARDGRTHIGHAALLHHHPRLDPTFDFASRRYPEQVSYDVAVPQDPPRPSIVMAAAGLEPGTSFLSGIFAGCVLAGRARDDQVRG